MGLLDPLSAALQSVDRFRPSRLRKLGQEKVSRLVLRELGRARARVAEVERTYPGATVREQAQRLIDGKKHLAGMLGGLSGIFGLASIPADLLVMTWLQLELLVDIATLHRVNLKTEGARGELLDLFGYSTGVGPLTRAGPQVLARVAALAARRKGISWLGRAVPFIASPIGAYLNNQHIQAVGEEAIRHYGGFDRAKAKARAGAR